MAHASHHLHLHFMPRQHSSTQPVADLGPALARHTFRLQALLLGRDLECVLLLHGSSTALTYGAGGVGRTGHCFRPHNNFHGPLSFGSAAAILSVYGTAISCITE